MTTNSVEGFFGIYQQCGEHHLHRYLNEFAFRYNKRRELGVDDAERGRIAFYGAAGKRLTYRRSDDAPKRLDSWRGRF